MYKIKKLIKIKKEWNKRIDALDKKLRRVLSEEHLDKKLLKRIGREISILGKEKLISDQTISLKEQLHSLLHSGSKNELTVLKNQLLYFYVELFKLNRKLHDAIYNELKNEFKNIKKRIKEKIKNPKIYKEVYRNLMEAASQLLNLGMEHTNKFKSTNPKNEAHLNFAWDILKKVDNIYDLLEHKDHKLHVERILFLRYTDMFNNMLDYCGQLAKLVIEDIDNIDKNKLHQLEEHEKLKHYSISVIIVKQIRTLTNFALRYSRNIIHSEPFYAGREKHIIITHDVKPVF